MSRTGQKAQDLDDSALVAASLAGDRAAFARIVSRYQRLLCSLAYSSVGNVSDSEDIAQDVFIEAWKKLASLKEPAKLKAWLCGILRFKVSHFYRREAGQPLRRSKGLEHADELASSEPKAEDNVIQSEEQALLWRAVEKVPATYREPLILFYRENQSTRQVAADLDLSEDAVKQRLSRGRRMLQAEMLKFVEKSLERSKPGATFTAAVLAAVATIPPPAKAASIGAATVKASSWLKWSAILTLLATFSGVISTFFGLRASLDQSRTQAERKNVFRVVIVLFFSPVFFAAILFALRQLALAQGSSAAAIAVATQVLVVAFGAGYAAVAIRLLGNMRVLRAEQRDRHPEAFARDIDRVDSTAREVQSRLRIAGIPVFHFRFGMPEKHDPPVFGWIAGGDRAYGLLMAWGGIAVAPVSIGIVSVGVVSVGTVGLGVFSVGAVAIGAIGFGAAAIGYQAYASLSSLGWQSAFSQGFAIAKDAAIGPVAIAREVNNSAAHEIGNLAGLDAAYLWVMGAIAALVIIPSAWHAAAVRKRMGRDGR